MEEKLKICTDILELKTYLNNYNKIVYIIDKNVYQLHKDYLATFNYENIYLFEASEDNKDFSHLLKIIDFLIENNITRTDLLCAIGGGVVTDICALAASVYLRGIKHINIPTTLLAMVDAAIGGKTGINYYNRKNIIGTFKEADLIFIDNIFLKTLTKNEYLSGMGEIIKYKMLDAKLDLNKDIVDIIKDSIMIKTNIVEQDFYDLNKRLYLNLGHSFGHLIELKYHIPHGIAIVNGIYLILKLEYDLKLIDKYIIDKFLDIIYKYHFQIIEEDYKKYLDNLFNDKKNLDNKLNLIFIDNNFKPYIYKTIKEELYDKIKS